MDYEPCPSDISDTDEDLPPHQYRVQRAPHISGNGNSMLGSGPYRRVQGDMEHQIHHLEKEAYCGVLRAFKAQSDAISWEKESLITELRKELRVSDDEHRDLLVRVNNDDIIRRIREWRQAGGHQTLSTSHPINDVSSLTPVSRKKQRTTQSVPTHAGHVAPPPTGSVGPRGRKPKQFPYSNSAAHETSMPGDGEGLVGKKVLTRWPDDNHFYEAMITRYNASDGRHELVYGTQTQDESFEWVNLKEIPFEDIQWVNEDPGLSHRGGPGEKRSMNNTGAVPGAGRKQNRSEIQNGAGNMTDDIEILHTDTLIKEVEKVVAASNPDRLEIEKAKKMLKEHEQALVNAISRLSYVSDGDSDGDQQY
ncbi:protein EMSY-LIKE 3-like isoform X3 [Chenopodium quinoa]|uniref:protein EMSY-LIKE 3-like isoform X3 n=1 Tax=Chenopodium quinoa TaxID=63459 RepID=UPI000B799C20|nr:protein EMSY-LIKE 3-like isoform X3 [Chenopodium quinoa]